MTSRDIARLAAFPADVVVTHPYEGGHPDHDSVAFAVHAAVGPSGLRGSATAPRLAEMTSYHTAEGSLSTSRLLTIAGAACARRREGLLVGALRERKRAMLDAFVTQAEMLAPFGTAAEPLRCAPSYDFTRAPHPGAIHYEGRPFGWTGARWRELARAAMEELGRGSACVRARPLAARTTGARRREGARRR